MTDEDDPVSYDIDICANVGEVGDAVSLTCMIDKVTGTQIGVPLEAVESLVDTVRRERERAL